MKSHYECENELIAIGFVVAFIILIIVSLIFHKELISFLVKVISMYNELGYIVARMTN